MRVLFVIITLLFLNPAAMAIDNAQVWNEYLLGAEKQIKGNWYKLSGMNRHKSECATNLFFNIKNTGEITNIKVLQSNCDEDIKNLAIEAVKVSSPLKPFPAAISATKEISIDYIFNYELLPENKEIFDDVAKDTQIPVVNTASDIANKLSSAPVPVTVEQLPAENAAQDTKVGSEKAPAPDTAENNNYKTVICALCAALLVILLSGIVFVLIKRKNKQLP